MADSPSEAFFVPEASIHATGLEEGEVTYCERVGDEFECKSYRRSAGIVGGIAEPEGLLTQVFRVREIIFESPTRIAPDAKLRTAWIMPEP